MKDANTIKGADGTEFRQGSRCMVRTGSTWRRGTVAEVLERHGEKYARVRTTYAPLRLARSGELKAHEPKQAA